MFFNSFKTSGFAVGQRASDILGSLPPQGEDLAVKYYFPEHVDAELPAGEVVSCSGCLRSDASVYMVGAGGGALRAASSGGRPRCSRRQRAQRSRSHRRD